MPGGRFVANFRPEWKPPAPPPAPGIVPPKAGVPTVFFDVTWHRREVGWDIAVRAYAHAMRMAGLDLRLPWVQRVATDEMNEIGGTNPRTNAWDAFVQSTCFATLEPMRGVVNMLRQRPGIKIIYTMFERQNFDPRIADLFQPLDAVWVPCAANRDVLRSMGVKQAVSFPHVHFEDDPLLKLPTPRENRIFYWIGNWSPRKAPENLIRAFLRAFKPGEAELVLKTGPWRFHRNWPEPEDVVAMELGIAEVRANGWDTNNWRGSLHIDRRALTRADMASTVHARGDVYVSASRGEGWDLPAYEAKIGHRQIITTDSRGPREFLGERDILIPAEGRITTHPDYGWEYNSWYADYSLEDLVSAMQRVRGQTPSEKLDWPRNRFTAETVGKDLRRWFDDLVPNPRG